MADGHSFFDDIVPPVVSEVIQAFASELSPTPPVHVPLRKDDRAVYGWPSDGIKEKINTDGGSIQFGWRMREWPGVLLTAEPHAVWVDSEGTLIDITRDVAASDTSLFVPVASDAEVFGPDQHPPTRYRVLYTAPDRSEAVAERIAQMKSGQRAYEERRAQKAGKTLEEWTHDKYYHEPLPGQIAAFIKACEAFDARLPTLASLIQTDPDVTQAQRLELVPDAPDGVEGEPMASDATDALAGDSAANIPVIDQEADEDDAFDDDEKPWNESWLAEDSLYQWARDRDTARTAILRTLFGE